MQRGFIAGAVVGALLAVGAGLALALVPTTPTWALWRLTQALDDGDVQELTTIVDLPAVALNAVQDLGSQQDGNPQNLQISQIAMAVLSGDRIRTVFDDPDHPVEVTPADFLAAWWSMRRNGSSATLTLQAGERQFHLDLEQRGDLDWKVVGVSPLGSLLRIEPDGEPT